MSEHGRAVHLYEEPAARTGTSPEGRRFYARGASSLVWLCLLLVVPPGAEPGGTGDRMDGDCYERRVLDAEGQLKGHQRIYIHETVPRPGGVQARVDVVRFETGDGPASPLAVEDRFDFKVLGRIAGDAPEETVLQLMGYIRPGGLLALDRAGEGAVFPPGTCAGQSLAPVRLDLMVQGGIVDLLGGRAEIRISQRRCRAAKEPVRESPEAYVIDGVVQVKMYLMGIRFRKARFASRHLVDPVGGLRSHVLENEDGERQELVLVDERACSPPWKPAG